MKVQIYSKGLEFQILFRIIINNFINIFQAQICVSKVGEKQARKVVYLHAINP